MPLAKPMKIIALQPSRRGVKPRGGAPKMKDETSSEIGDEWRKELIWAHIESGLDDSGGYLNCPQI